VVSRRGQPVVVVAVEAGGSVWRARQAAWRQAGEQYRCRRLRRKPPPHTGHRHSRAGNVVSTSLRDGVSGIGGTGRGGHGGGEDAVELAGDVALEAAPDLAEGFALRGAPGDVGEGPLTAAHPREGDGVHGAVERPVPAAVESVACRAPAAGLKRTGARQGGASIGSDLPLPRRAVRWGCSHSMTINPAAVTARASPTP
jgi:hypothetical protein